MTQAVATQAKTSTSNFLIEQRCAFKKVTLLWAEVQLYAALTLQRKSNQIL